MKSYTSSPSYSLQAKHCSKNFFISGRNAAGKGTNYAYQGVEPSNGLPEDDYIRHAYYQWVPFVLFLQGMYYD